MTWEHECSACWDQTEEAVKVKVVLRDGGFKEDWLCSECQGAIKTLSSLDFNIEKEK